MAKKILIVEDDKFLRELIVQKLKKEGYDVFEATDGEMAVKNVKETMPDLVLLDLILPCIHGFEVLETIRRDESLSAMPVIILSNLGNKDEVEKGLKMGATDYMIKAHFTPAQIIEKINSTLK